jgi:type IV pilus assembly protein PilP
VRRDDVRSPRQTVGGKAGSGEERQMIVRRFNGALAGVVMLTAAAHAQQPVQQAKPNTQQAPAPQPPAPAAAAPAEKPAEKPAETPAPPPPQESYSYQPQGRRDPFLNLLGTGRDTGTATARRGEGPASMTTAEISVRGILQSRGALVAMVTGPDGKTYVVHSGDKLADGTIKSITPQGLIVIQEVNDPLSLVKQREVTKLLHALEVAK